METRRNIVVIGSKGGVGTTTLVATIAAHRNWAVWGVTEERNQDLTRLLAMCSSGSLHPGLDPFWSLTGQPLTANEATEAPTIVVDLGAVDNVPAHDARLLGAASHVLLVVENGHLALTKMAEAATLIDDRTDSARVAMVCVFDDRRPIARADVKAQANFHGFEDLLYVPNQPEIARASDTGFVTRSAGFYSEVDRWLDY